jgi:DNA-binding IclR family transcriptional regulator
MKVTANAGDRGGTGGASSMTSDRRSSVALQPVGSLPATREYSQSAMRTLQALEALTFAPASAPQLAQRIGVNERTARRILHSLHSNLYVEQHVQRGPGRHQYTATLRLLGLAVQLACHHPAIAHAQHQVTVLHETTGLSAYAAAPTHDQVVVVASAGVDAPSPWTVLPVRASAAGQVLLAHDHRWRRQVEPGEYADRVAAMTRHRGYALNRRDFGPLASLAAAVCASGPPEVAIAVTAPAEQFSVNEARAAQTVMALAAKMRE